MAIGTAVGIGVISSAIWAGIGAGGYGLSQPIYRYWATRRPIGRLLRRNSKRSVLVIQSAVRSADKTEYFKYLVTPDCVTGYYHLHERLRDVGYSSEQIFVRFPAELTPDGLSSHDIVLIGGYENNQISADMNSDNQAVYLENNKIYVRGKQIPYDIALVGGSVRKDYCLISRRPNPFASGLSDSWIVAFEGIRHYGTEAGIRFLTAHNMRDAIFAQARAASEVYIVISCGVTHVTDSSYSLKEIKVEYVWIDGKVHDVSAKQ